MLSHPNVLKLAGVQGDMDKGQFTTISEWMFHGNIMQYIRRNHVNRLELVRSSTISTALLLRCDKQLHGAAQGLSYLHECVGLAHGDLKGVGFSSFRNRSLF